MPKVHIRWTILIIGLAVFFSDAITKFLVQKHLPLRDHYALWYPYGGIGVFKDFFGIEFSIIHETNKGAAWGVLHTFQIPLLILRIFLIIGMSIYLLFYNTRRQWEIPMALIIAGAAGNVVDYFLYGHVIDMIHFVFWGYDYPIFNLADTAIFIGIAWLLTLSWRDKPAVKQNP